MTISHVTTSVSKLVDKDVVLVEKAECGINIAQFASFFPEGNDKTIRFIRTRTCSMDYPKMPIEEVVDILMQTAIDKTLTIRTFTPANHQGNPFIYGIESADEVVAKIKDLPDSFLRFIIAFGVFDEDSIPKGTLSVHRKNIMKLGKMLYNVRVKPHTTEPVLPLQYTRATYGKIASFVGMLAKYPGFLL